MTGNGIYIAPTEAERSGQRPRRVPTSDKAHERLKTVRRSNVLYEGDVASVAKKLVPGTVRYRILMGICVAVMAVCGILAAQYFHDTGNAQRGFNDIAVSYTTMVAPGRDEGEHNKDVDGLPPIVDFAALKAANPDVSGWLKIPGTTVNYPVVTNPEPDFYLHRDFYKDDSYAGSIFTDHQNTVDLAQDHIVLYGHHMDMPMMFHDVALYTDPEFLDSHRVIYFETPDTTYVLRPIGVYIAPGTEVAVRDVTQQTEGDFQNYLDSRLARCDVIYRDDYQRSTTDRLFTLITCTNAGDNRVIVECVPEQAYPTSYVPNVISNSPDV